MWAAQVLQKSGCNKIVIFQIDQLRVQKQYTWEINYTTECCNQSKTVDIVLRSTIALGAGILQVARATGDRGIDSYQGYDLPAKLFQIVCIVFDNVVDCCIINFPVHVDKQVPEPCHLLQVAG